MLKCGIDIGGTAIKIGYFDEANNLVKKISIATSKNQNEIVIDLFNELIKNDYGNIIGYSVAIPGVIINDIVVYAPNTNIVGLNFKKMLNEKLNALNVIIDNDANLAALAESRVSNISDLVLITLGTGVGGGIIIDGKIYNKNGFAGEIGHIKVDFGRMKRSCGCGSKGCVEAYSSASNMPLEYFNKTGEMLNTIELFSRASKKDKLAIRCINNSLEKLGVALANISSTLAIKNFRIAGGLSNAGDMLIIPLRKYFKKYAIPNLRDTSIDIAYLKDEAGIDVAKYLF